MRRIDGLRPPIEKAEAGFSSAVVFRGLPIVEGDCLAPPALMDAGACSGWRIGDQEDEELELGEGRVD